MSLNKTEDVISCYKHPRGYTDPTKNRSSVLDNLDLSSTPSPSPSTGIPPGVGMPPYQFQALFFALWGGHTSPAPSHGVVTSCTEELIRKRWRANIDTLIK